MFGLPVGLGTLGASISPATMSRLGLFSTATLEKKGKHQTVEKVWKNFGLLTKLKLRATCGFAAIAAYGVGYGALAGMKTGIGGAYHHRLPR
jgi:hypothetical protein